MKINNINSTNFNGIYRIKNTYENIREIEQYLIPAYKFKQKEKISYFVGTNPFKSNFLALIKRYSSDIDVSVEDLKTFAKKYGIDISDLGADVIYVITGNKDNEAYDSFLKQRIFKQREDNIQAESCVAALNKNLKLPEFLSEILQFSILDKKETMLFHQFAPHSTEVQQPQEIFIKAISEK